jgi:hypothetical protein
MPHQPQPRGAMPVMWFSIRLWGEPDVSHLQSRPADIFPRIAGAIRDAAPSNADIGFGFLLLFTCQVTAIAVHPKYLVPTAVLSLLLLICGRLTLGRSVWLRRVGWVAPRQGFWFYSFGAGVAAAAGVWAIATFFPPRARSSSASV